MSIHLVGKSLRTWRVISCLLLVIELFTVLFVLFAVLSLSPAICMADFNPLQLVLDSPYLILDAKVLHLQLEDSNDILDLGVVFHCEVLRKGQVTHKFALKFVHSLAARRHSLNLLNALSILSKEL